MQLKLILFVVLVYAAQINGDVQENSRAQSGIEPAGFINIGNRTYYMTPTPAVITVASAATYCADFGMNLVSFETVEEWELVRAYVASVGRDKFIWTSGQKQNNVWMWRATNEPFSFTAWSDGQPQSYYNEVDEVYFHFQWGWYDTRGGLSYNDYMCEL